MQLFMPVLFFFFPSWQVEMSAGKIMKAGVKFFGSYKVIPIILIIGEQKTRHSNRVNKSHLCSFSHSQVDAPLPRNGFDSGVEVTLTIRHNNGFQRDKLHVKWMRGNRSVKCVRLPGFEIESHSYPSAILRRPSAIGSHVTPPFSRPGSRLLLPPEEQLCLWDISPSQTT